MGGGGVPTLLPDEPRACSSIKSIKRSELQMIGDGLFIEISVFSDIANSGMKELILWQNSMEN